MTSVRAVPEPLTARPHLDAPPHQVWQVVSDVRRTGEWSPECYRVVPLGRLRRGTLLLGLNRRGRTVWPTLSRVIDHQEGTEIAWITLTNGARWRYRLLADGTGTDLVDTRETPDGVGRFATWFTRRFLGGQAGHDVELLDGMNLGLTRIAHLVEHPERADAPA